MPPETAVPPASPSDLGVEIDSVNQSLWQYVKQRKRGELLLFAPLVIIWEILAVFLLIKSQRFYGDGTSSGFGRAFVYLALAPLLVFGGWIGRMRQQFEDAFLEDFAFKNGYFFQKDGLVDETYGTIFRLPGDQQVSDVVTGTYNDNDLRLFLYELTVGSGRSRTTYENTVIELDVHGLLPDLLMVNKHSSYAALKLSNAFGTGNTIKLEGDFNDYFTLYAPPGSEVEALEVFSPDIMALMEDDSKQYTVEFTGSRMYIYFSKLVATTEQLTQIFTLAKRLADKLAPLASRLENDPAIAAAPVNVMQVRKQPLLSGRTGMIAGIGLTVVGFAAALFLSSTLTTQQISGIQSSGGYGAALPAGNSPSASAIAKAVAASDQWLAAVRQPDIATAYSLEDPTYQQKYSLQDETQALAPLIAPGATTSIIQTAGGLRRDNVTQLVSVVYRYASDTAQPLYLEVYVQNNQGLWQVWGYNYSPNPIQSDIPS